MQASIAMILVQLATPGAFAQDGPFNQCERGLGGAGGFTPGGRDWELVTPGRYAETGSAVLMQGCLVEQQVLGRGAIGFGLDVVPTYQHSYRRLGLRAPLLVGLHWDLNWRVGERQTLGPSLVTNGLAVGGGLRWRYAMAPSGTWGWAPGVDVRANVLRGTRTDYQVVVALRLATTDVSGNGEVQEVVPEGDVPQPKERDWRVRLGFEAGSVLGVRAEAAHENGWGFGLRAGENTAWRRDVALQPLGLAYLVASPGDLRLALSTGYTRFEGEWVPVFGGGVMLGEADDFVRLQLGGLFEYVPTRAVREGYRAPDITFAIVW